MTTELNDTLEVLGHSFVEQKSVVESRATDWRCQRCRHHERTLWDRPISDKEQIREKAPVCHGSAGGLGRSG